MSAPSPLLSPAGCGCAVHRYATPRRSPLFRARPASGTGRRGRRPPRPPPGPGTPGRRRGHLRRIARVPGWLGDRRRRPGGQPRNPLVGGEVVGGHDLHQTRERSNPEQVLAELAGVDVGQLTHQERPFSRLADTLELPGYVADEGIALAARQRDENDHGTRCVAPSQGDDHRAVAVYVVARREAEIRRAAEFVLVDLVA